MDCELEEQPSCTSLGHDLGTSSKWGDGCQGPLRITFTNFNNFLAVRNRLWFIGDRQIHLAFEVLMKHSSRFHQLVSLVLLQGFNTCFSEFMLLGHMPAVMLDMVNKYKYLPELIIIHVGASDFSRVTNHQQITAAACRSTDSFHGLMFSLMLSLPFYINWDSQWAARQARAHFNGSLAKHAQLKGGYIIRHPDIAAVTDPGLYDTNYQGDLTEFGYLLASSCWVVLACRRQLMVMNNAIQAAH